MSLEAIDTSYWLTKDKTWMDNRKAAWPAVEKVVCENRRKADVNVIKQYYLRGKMPKWEKYKDWDDSPRHVDLTIFLWLHPSDDIEVLKPLYRQYMESELIHPLDIRAGYGTFLRNELLMGTGAYKSLSDYPFPFIATKNLIIFQILFEDINFVKQAFNQMLGETPSAQEKTNHVIEYLGYTHFCFMRNWLLQDINSFLMSNCLYQYDDVINWCMTTLTVNKEKEFIEEIKKPGALLSYQKALYCIYHFDTEKEGDTCRTRTVYKIRKLLDENDFIPEFKQIWLDIKADKIDVKDPWEY